MKFGIREIVFVLLLMAIPLGSWWLVFRPQNARNDEMKRQIEVKQAKLRELNQATATIGDLRNEIAQLSKGISYFQSKLPSEKEIDKILQEVWMLAETNQLNTKSIRTLDKNSGSGVAQMVEQAEQPIAVQLEGDFRGFYAFLLALENQSRIMRINSMDLNRLDKSKSPEGNMVASFEMSIFFDRSNG